MIAVASPAYNAAVQEAVQGLLATAGPFLARPIQRLVALYGVAISLGQRVLKFAASGIPDFYQGTELWDLALVDPGSRHPVDFARRAPRGDLEARTGAADDGLTALYADLLEREKAAL